MIKKKKKKKTDFQVKSLVKDKLLTKEMGSFIDQKKKKQQQKLISVAVLVLVITAGAGLIFTKFVLKNQTQSNYQAVFLTNNQVYFGQLKKRSSKYPVLTNVYYLHSQENLQKQEEGEAAGQPNLTLVKLGNELHGPDDEIQLNKDHILFIENLKPDSRVVKAILQTEGN